jgi:hypothetical protein
MRARRSFAIHVTSCRRHASDATSLSLSMPELAVGCSVKPRKLDSSRRRGSAPRTGGDGRSNGQILEFIQAVSEHEIVYLFADGVTERIRGGVAHPGREAELASRARKTGLDCTAPGY